MKFIGIGALLIVSLIFVKINYTTGGSEYVKTGLFNGLKFFGSIIPMLILFSLLAGQINAFYQKNPALTRSVMAGKPGIVKAAFLGMNLPGGISACKVLQEELENCEKKKAIITFLLATTVLNWSLIIFRLAFLGGKITTILYGIGGGITALTVGMFLLF